MNWWRKTIGPAISGIMRSLSTRVSDWSGDTQAPEKRTHIILLDGTSASLKPGAQTHIGTLYHLLNDGRPDRTVHYSAGLQWGDWRSNLRVITGAGLGHQIRQAYGALVTRYRPGDDVYIFGYSRGAFAARSLCGMIDRVGLLQSDYATARNVDLAWRQYRNARGYIRFRENFCHPASQIRFLGVFDTVSALGLRIPVLWKFLPDLYTFHDHAVSRNVEANYHALALDETRLAYAPECWDLDVIAPKTIVQQVWFRGAHGDIGGHLGTFEPARPLANIPLVWMLERAADRGLELPPDWRARFVMDATAPSVGTWRRWGKFLIFRAKRRVAKSDHEWIHSSVAKSH